MGRNLSELFCWLVVVGFLLFFVVLAIMSVAK